MKMPALQFYPGDWRKDPGVQALSFEERGIWIELLFLMHESDCRGKLLLNGKPMANERLANILHLSPEKISTTISTLLELGVAGLCPDTGALMNRRMVRDEALIEKRRAAGSLGGNPAFEKGKHNQYYKQIDKQTNKQKISPSSSSLSSSSDINTGDETSDHVDKINGHSTELRFPNCPQQKIVALYGEILPMAIQPRIWDGSDSAVLQTRWRETFARLNLETEDDGIEWFRTMFSAVAQSAFLTGQCNTPGRKPFTLRLPWIVKKENFKKIIEGFYNN